MPRRKLPTQVYLFDFIINLFIPARYENGRSLWRSLGDVACQAQPQTHQRLSAA
jgi:hypothetical protein